MQRLGFPIFVAGIIVASWYGARHVPVQADVTRSSATVTSMDRLSAWASVAGLPFAMGTLMMIGGGVLTRRSRVRPRPAAVPDLADAPDNMSTMLKRIEDSVLKLPDANVEEQAGVLHDALDRLLEDLVPLFLDQRARHVAELGLERYAEMSSAFASAERALGRAWSALTDEAWAEVPTCLETARRSIVAAAEVVDPKRS